MKKHKWKTHQVIQETKDAVTIIFNTGRAGLTYQAGQYLNISCTIDGHLISRSYSFSSAPADKFPAITVKRVANGKMSNYLVDHAKEISEWDIEAPFGNFMLNPNFSDDLQFVFLAGGSGISPLFSMLKSLAGRAQKPVLLYSNRTPEDTLFQRELEEMEIRNQLYAFHSFTAEGLQVKTRNSINGRFSPPIIQTLIKQHIQDREQAHYFICGPTALMQLYQDTLRSLHIPESQIHLEHFDPITVESMAVETSEEHKEILVSYFETYFKDNEEQTYECTSLIEVQSGQSLLDAMGAHNIQVPNSCKKGTCGSCWAIKENGIVKMVNNYALTDEEVAEGKILLCQSFALDQSVAIVIGS